MYNRSGIEDFLKGYYYSRLVELYRESPLDDSYYPITVNSSGKKPMQVYPKLPERLNGRAGSFLGLSTLSSSWKNEGTSYSNIKLLFQKMTVSEDRKSRSISFTFYITKSRFVAAFGYDMSAFYVRQAIRELPQTQADAIWSTALEAFKKEFTNTRPRFLFKSSRLYDNMQKLEPGKITLTDWQKYRGKFEKDYTSATFRAVDADGKDVVNEYGYAVAKDGARIEDEDEARSRLADTAYILITVSDDYIYPTLGLEHSLFVSGEERDNVSGYLVVKKLTQTLKDNYISKSYSNSWIETDLENQPTEYVSFGDDRNVTVKSRNVLLDDKETVYEKMRLTQKEERSHDSETITLDKYGRILTTSGYSQFVKTATPEDQGLKPVYRKAPESPVLLDSEGTRSLRWSADGKTYFISDDIDVYYSAEGDIILSVPPTRMHTGDITDVTLVYKVIFILVRRTFLYFTNITSVSIKSGYRTTGAARSGFRVSRPQIRLLHIIRELLLALKALLRHSLLRSGYRTSGAAKAHKAIIEKAKKVWSGYRTSGVARIYRAWVQKAGTAYSGYKTSGVLRAYKAVIEKAKKIWSGYRTSGISKIYRAVIEKAKKVWLGYRVSVKSILIALKETVKTAYIGVLASVPKTDHILALWLEFSEFRTLYRLEKAAVRSEATETNKLYILGRTSGQEKEYQAAAVNPPVRGGFRLEKAAWTIGAAEVTKQVDIYKNGALVG